ncbi:MAG: hypothetical protein HC877_15925 [Thioploca sp.]|nr:hypothetical protein [Thioploca sp.]
MAANIPTGMAERGLTKPNGKARAAAECDGSEVSQTGWFLRAQTGWFPRASTDWGWFATMARLDVGNSE